MIARKGNIKLLFKFFLKKIMGIPLGETSASKEAEQIKINKSSIANLNSGEVGEYMKKFPNDSFEEWKNFADKPMDLNPGSKVEIIRKICTFIRERKVRLYVVDIPVSPFLLTMIPPEKYRGYLIDLKNFETCAERVLLPDSNSLGIGNQHFINRDLAEGFPYRNIRESQPIQYPFKSYDLDHMNPVGADIFSDYLAQNLGRDVMESVLENN